MVNLVTCIGLGVEFCAHLVIKFRNTVKSFNKIKPGENKQRVKLSMLTMGTSVMVGIASTKFIGVIVLAFASSTLFRLYYFRMYILMVIVGTFNVMICIYIIKRVYVSSQYVCRCLGLAISFLNRTALSSPQTSQSQEKIQRSLEMINYIYFTPMHDNYYIHLQGINQIWNVK